MNEFTLKFFAKLREDIGLTEMRISCTDVANLSDLADYLIEHNPSWAPFLDKQLLSAVNQEMVTSDRALKAGDEVALFPPVTGG